VQILNLDIIFALLWIFALFL